MLAPTNDRIEIRMFGRLFVRRSNGDVVDSDEWSTGKTADLLRLLALNGNRPVSVQSLINKLWPDVDDDKAKAAFAPQRHVCVKSSESPASRDASVGSSCTTPGPMW